MPTQEESRVDTRTDSLLPVTTASEDSGDPGVVQHVTYRRSASFARIAGALAKAQGQITGASKDNVNPHFKSKYADLAAVWDACREPLSANGIAVLQPPSTDGPIVTVTTMLAHNSGEWIESDLTMVAGQNTPQGIGSCITYARRYALQSMVGIAPEDDDGNAASQPTNGGPRAVPRETPREPSRPSAPEGFDGWIGDMEATAEEGTAALEAAWKKSQPYMRKHLTDTDNAKWERLKAKAAAVKVSA